MTAQEISRFDQWDRYFTPPPDLPGYVVFVVVVSRNPGGNLPVEATDVFEHFGDARKHAESAMRDTGVNWVKIMLRAGWDLLDWQNPDRVKEHEQTGSRRG